MKSSNGHGPAWAEEVTATVRPYAITDGRTQAQHDLSLSTILAPVERPADLLLSPEAHQVLGLYKGRRASVAEVAGQLPWPVQVTRIILSDLITADALTILVQDGDSGPSVMVMQAVLTGLKSKGWADVA